MKAVLMSIQPKWCELIANGKKTVEVRKTKPKLETPFKVYIYCTKGNLALLRDDDDAEEKYKYDVWDFAEFHQSCGKKILLGGKVIGEFVCDKVFDICIEISKPDDLPGYPFPCTGLTDKEILQYLGNGNTGYGWHISDLKFYDKPKPFTDFWRCNYSFDCGVCYYFDGFTMSCEKPKRPPQSWCLC